MAELHLLFWSKAWLENPYLENLFVNTASDDPPASHTSSACVLRSISSLQPFSVQHQLLSLGSENCWHVLAWMDIKVNLVFDVASRSRPKVGSIASFIPCLTRSNPAMTSCIPVSYSSSSKTSTTILRNPLNALSFGGV